MKKHTIELAAIHGYEGRINFASAVGEGVNKHLDAKVSFQMAGPKATYLVTSHHRVSYEGDSLTEAVAAYNSL